MYTSSFVWMTNVLHKHEKQFWVEYCLRKNFYKELANIEREALTKERQYEI